MSNILRKIKKNKDNSNYIITEEELQEIQKRILELKEEAIICVNAHNFNRINEIGNELKALKKKLKLHQKYSK